MSLSNSMSDETCAVYIDAGTTNTRVWLMHAGDVLASASCAIGIRDAAREKSSASCETALRDLIVQVTAGGLRTSEDCIPASVAACGMIGSSLGLADVPHVSAPAGMAELAAASQWRHFPTITDLPVLIVPGIRSGPVPNNVDSISEFDVMRGEETLCTGLVLEGSIRCPALLLNLGSHWKAIHIRADGNIDFSVTSLSGEFIQALQTDTILAGSVVKERPTRLAAQWIEAGMKEQRKSGLSRALFCVRLLDLAKQGSADDRYAYLAGAVIASDLDALLSRGALQMGTPVAIVGHRGIAEAWQHALAQCAITATVIPAEDSQRALLNGLRHILQESLRLRPPEPVLQRSISQ
jgi:2-dehydro-3-deoxygalactonokinase